MDGLIDGWMDGWMDGWVGRLDVFNEAKTCFALIQCKSGIIHDFVLISMIPK
jgi:hypothetical protein